MPKLDQGGALLGYVEVDDRWRLHAIVLEGCDDLDVEILHATCGKMANRGPYPRLVI